MNLNSYMLFSVLSNKLRWQIINVLDNKEKSVNEISKEIKQEQSKISHNLKILLECNIVFVKKKGKLRIYSLNKKTIKPLINIVNKHTCEFCKKCKRC